MAPPQKPPSEAQLAYARQLGLTVATDATGAEVSDLLEAHEWRRQPATPALQAFASQLGVPFTRETCLEALHDRITDALMAPDRGTDLAAWYAFHVARDLGVTAPGPDEQGFQDIGQQLAGDPAVLRSIRRRGQGRWLRFGDWQDADDFTVKGGSRNTAAYEAAAAAIRTRFAVAAPALRQRLSAPIQIPAGQAKAASSGCLPVVLAATVLVAMLSAG